MAGYLNITKPEYLDILRNRNKSVSSSISHNKLLKKVKYLSKQDLNHLLTIRGLVSNDSSLESIIEALFKDIHEKKQNKLIDDLHKYNHSKIHSKALDDICRYHHKQNLKNLKEQIYRNLQKRQSKQIVNELEKINILNLSKLIKRENISQNELNEIKRLNNLPTNVLKK